MLVPLFGKAAGPAPIEVVRTLLTLGAFGFFGISILCPLLAWPGYYFRSKNLKKVPPALPQESPAPVVEIVIPAHNEAKTIGATLASIHRSIRHAQADSAIRPLSDILIHLGADACGDAT